MQGNLGERYNILFMTAKIYFTELQYRIISVDSHLLLQHCFFDHTKKMHEVLVNHQCQAHRKA